jgi:homoserine kinase type II
MNTRFTKSDYEEIAKLFRLGTITEVTTLHNGLQTPKLLFRTKKGDFVVSKYTLNNPKNPLSKSVSSLQYEIDFLEQLKTLPIPHYVRSAHGKCIEKYGQHWITVDKFVSGTHPKKFTKRMVYQLGKFLGEFHQKGRSFRQVCKSRRRFYDLRATIVRKMAVYANKQGNKQLQAVVNEIRNGVERTRLPQGLPQGIVHVDIKPDNELFNGEKLRAVLDFGNMYQDTLLIDVGKVIMWNCVRNKKIDKELVTAFLKGYEEKRRFTVAERRQLKNSVLFAIYSHIWVDLYHVPLKYVPESYVRYLVREFLPAARSLENSQLG